MSSNNIRAILQHHTGQLAAALGLDADSARIEVQCLLQYALQVNRAWLITHAEQVLDEEQYARYLALFGRRLGGEPVAYILGSREFYGLDFRVTPATLIPRPETELLVERALQRIPPAGFSTALTQPVGHPLPVPAGGIPAASGSKAARTGETGEGVRVGEKEKFRVLDLGTGSGAIALSLAHTRPDVEVTAVDASPEALEVARENARRLLGLGKIAQTTVRAELVEAGVSVHISTSSMRTDSVVGNVRLLRSDWFDSLAGERFDLIVSNPPYVAAGDAHLARGDLRFEPRSALASGADGLDDIRRIVAQAPAHLNSGGSLLFEHGYDQAERVRALLQQAGFADVCSARDLAGIERVSGGTWSSVHNEVHFTVRGELVEPPFTDTLQRPLRDLRISVTDRCNLRCTYCMPREVFDQHHVFLPRAELLSFEEIERLARSFVQLGVQKLRLTGGEPLLRRGVEQLVERLAALRTPQNQPVEIAMTTNGVLLAAKAQALRDAGLARVTVSLDSLDDTTFRRISDSKVPVQTVLDGIAAAQRAGFAPVKVNMVVQRGVNDHEVLAMAEHFRAGNSGAGAVLRFIEYMDVGSSNGWKLDEVVSARRILEQIDARHPLEPVGPDRPGEVAERWRYRDGGGEIGVIASITQAFCHGCTRARLSTDGKLYTCLFATAGIDLRGPLRAGATDQALAGLIAGCWQQRGDRYSQLRHAATDPAALPKIEMSYIGG